jgi:hypothetical protein
MRVLNNLKDIQLLWTPSDRRLIHQKSRVITLSAAERVNVVLGIYKHYPGSISSLRQYPGHTSLSRTLPSIVHRNKIPAFEVVSRVAVVTCRLMENGGDGVLFLVTTEILGNVCIYPGRHLSFLAQCIGALTSTFQSMISKVVLLQYILC